MNSLQLKNLGVALGCVLGLAALGLHARSLAGCGDTLVMRVDSQKLEFSDGAEPSAVQLQGALGWEASPDGWQIHPIGGTALGFVHLGCPKGDGTCSAQLRRFAALAGTDAPLTFSGQFVKDVLPEGIHRAGSTAPASLPPWPNNPSTGGVPLNRDLWPTVQKLPGPGGTTPARGCSSTGAEAAGASATMLLALALRRRPRMRLA